MGSSPSHNATADDSTIRCDVCQRQNKGSTAVSYCKDCEETLCQNCDNVHRNLKQSQDHTLLTEDQLKQYKSRSQLQNSENTKSDDDAVPGRVDATTKSVASKGNTAGAVQGRQKNTKSDYNAVPERTKDTYRDNYNAVGGVKVAKHNPDSVPGRVKDTQTTAGAVSGRMVVRNNDQSSVPGRKLDSSSDKDTVPSVLDLTVSDIKHHNVSCQRVTSVVFMSSGHVVLACGNDGLKLLDKDFKQLSQLSLISTCACKVSDGEVLVSQAEVLPKMISKNVLTTGRIPRGVCYHKGEIYVACGNCLEGEVLVMKMDGTLVRRLGVHDGTYMFTWPYDVKVNNAGDKVFVTDWGTRSVTCIDQTGRVVFKYTDTVLQDPAGMLVDNQDNVLVTDFAIGNVHVINKKGRKRKTLRPWSDGLHWPQCISYRHDDGFLAIGMYSLDKTKSLVTVKTSLA